ncbi:MAG: hypothetical protein K2X86_01990, partial [Cytophagaceae bacterium]|nr:hypothetical protein [Cytophagaceae bacterium]
KPFFTSNVFVNYTNLIVPGNPELVEYYVTDMTGITIYRAVLYNPAEEIVIGNNLAPAAYIILVKTATDVSSIKICKLK